MEISGDAKPTRGVASVLNNPTVEKLKDMKPKVMAAMLRSRFNSQELSFEERLGLMVEKVDCKMPALKAVKKAALGMDTCIEDIDYSVDRSIDKKTIQVLSTCAFLEQKLNIVISGKTGSGKSYLSCAFGNNACRQGYTVKYYRIPELLLEIQDAKNDYRYSKFLKQLQKVKLLILDDIGLKSYTLEESRDLLEITESRYNKASTILSGQVTHTKWYDLFPDPTIADAIMDRIIHNSYILALNSKKSMREVMAKKKIELLKTMD